MVSNNFQQSNGKDFVIYPFEEKFTKGASYDLSLKEIVCISDDDDTKKLIDEIANANNKENTNNSFVILPYQRYLAVTKEHVWLSKFLVGTLHARATLAAKGLIINSTKIDPNFQGQLLISVFNASNDFVYLKKEEPFLTLILHKLEICAVKTQTLAAKRVLTEMLTCCDNNSPKNQALITLTQQIDVEDDNSSKFKVLVENAKTPPPFKKLKKSLYSLINAATSISAIVFILIVIIAVRLFTAVIDNALMAGLIALLALLNNLGTRNK